MCNVRMRQGGARASVISRGRGESMAANADFAAAQHAPEEVSRRKVKDDERGAGHDCEFV